MKILFYTISALLSICSAQSLADEDDVLARLDAVNKIQEELFKAMFVPDVVHTWKFPPDKYIRKDVESTQHEIDRLLDEDDPPFDEMDVHKAQANYTAAPKPTTKCSDDIVQLLFNWKSQQVGNMIDSYGKLPSGLIGGSINWPGYYKECTDVYVPIDDGGHGDFHGRYCTVKWSATLSKNKTAPLTTGICVPDSCTSDEVRTATKNVGKLLKNVPGLSKIAKYIRLDSIECKTGAEPLDSGAIALISVLCLFLFLVLLGTSVTIFQTLSWCCRRRSSVLWEKALVVNYGSAGTTPSAAAEDSKDASFEKDLASSLNHHRESNNDQQPLFQSLPSRIRRSSSSAPKTSVKDVLLCFCAITNGEKILKTDVPTNQLLSLHGIRFLSLSWVILGHVYITSVAFIANKAEALEDINTFLFQMCLQSPFSVDSFFLLSGFLLTYLFLKEADKRQGKINWLYFYLHRIYRLTPAYIIIVAFYMVLFKYLGSGPFWVDNHGDDCRHTWWMHLIYINNFIPVHDMCVGWSWYLANDMQFYLISPLFLYPLWRWRKLGFTIILGLLFGSWVTTGLLSATYDLIPMFVGVTNVSLPDLPAYQERMWFSYDVIYDKPYCRIGPYLIGALLGFALYKTSGRKSFMTMGQQLLGWAVGLFCSLSVVFGLYQVNITPTISAFYNTFCRSSYSIGLAWLIFVCETGHAGLLYKFLYLKFWIPLSRLTYCAYLVHPIIVHWYYQGLQTTIYFTHSLIVITFLGILVISYVLAFLYSLTFESPLLNIEKLLLRKKER